MAACASKAFGPVTVASPVLGAEAQPKKFKMQNAKIKMAFFIPPPFLLTFFRCLYISYLFLFLTAPSLKQIFSTHLQILYPRVGGCRYLRLILSRILRPFPKHKR